jgi:hypothetical protein
MRIPQAGITHTPVRSMVAGGRIPQGIGSLRVRTTTSGKWCAKNVVIATDPFRRSRRRSGPSAVRTRPSTGLNKWRRDTVKERSSAPLIRHRMGLGRVVQSPDVLRRLVTTAPRGACRGLRKLTSISHDIFPAR